VSHEGDTRYVTWQEEKPELLHDLGAFIGNMDQKLRLLPEVVRPAALFDALEYTPLLDALEYTPLMQPAPVANNTCVSHVWQATRVSSKAPREREKAPREREACVAQAVWASVNVPCIGMCDILYAP